MAFVILTEKPVSIPAEPGLDCTDYVDESYWEPFGAGTFGPGGWTSINDEGEDLIFLLPTGSWRTGFQPTIAKIYFTGVATVDIGIEQQAAIFQETLAAVNDYTSGAEIDLTSWASPEHELSTIYIGNFPGTGEFVVSSIEFCTAPPEPAGCQEYTVKTDSWDSPAGYPDLNTPAEIEVKPQSFGTFNFTGYVLEGVDEASYPLYATSSDESAFRVTVANAEGTELFDVATTVGSLWGLVPCGYYSTENGILRVTLENEGHDIECNFFDLQVGTDIQVYANDTDAMDSPAIDLKYEDTDYNGYEHIYVPVIVTIDTGKYGAVRYSKIGGGLGGYSVTVRNRKSSTDSFWISLYDGNQSFIVSDTSSGGVASVYVDYPETDDFYISIHNGVGAAQTEFSVMFPQPF